MESFETRGNRWLPQQPENVAPGILKFDPVNGCVLEIMSDALLPTIFDMYSVPIVEGSSLGVMGSSNEIALILGFAKGDPVTLYKCRQAGFTTSTGYNEYFYRAKIIFWGNLFEKEEDIVFESIFVNYSYLEEWVGIGGFDGKGKRDESGRITEISATYQRPDRREFSVNDFSVAFDHELNVPSFQFDEIHASQKTFLEITPETPLHFDDYRNNILYPIRDFISLGIGRAVIPVILRGHNKNHRLELQNGETRVRDTAIYYAAQGADIPTKNLDWGDALFSFKILTKTLVVIYQNGFRYRRSYNRCWIYTLDSTIFLPFIHIWLS